LPTIRPVLVGDAPRSQGTRELPFCADFGSMPITTLAVQIRAFCTG